MSFKASSEHRDDDVASVAAACSSIAIRSATLRGERWRRTTALQVLNRAVAYTAGAVWNFDRVLWFFLGVSVSVSVWEGYGRRGSF